MPGHVVITERQDRTLDRQRPRLENLQGLRAFAALAVVQLHTGIRYGSWHTPGSFGVDIFFVLSGFIMSMICSQEAKSFLVKRLTRILPPYWALTLISFAGLLASHSLDPTSPRGIGALLKSLFFIPYARFNGDLEPVLGTGWTLNYEMTFYVVLAIALVLWKKRADLLSIGLLACLMLVAHFAPAGSVFSRFYGRPIMGVHRGDRCLPCVPGNDPGKLPAPPALAAGDGSSMRLSSLLV